MAGLSSIPESKLTLGGIWARPRLYHKTKHQSRVYPNIADTKGGLIGISTNLEHLTSYPQLRPWTFGVCIYSPIDHIISTSIPSSNTEKNFIFYLDHSQVIGIFIGLSYQVLPKVSIGISANILFDLLLDPFYFLLRRLRLFCVH